MSERVTTDSRGFRNPGPDPAAPNPIRILGLGDSFMFGWGVSDAETFLARLPSSLSRRLPGTAWQTTNTAVPGYNTAMEIETLVEKGLATRPDLVILGWVNNDLDLPSFLRRLPSALALDRSFLAHWIASRLDPSRTDPFSTEVYTIRPFDQNVEPDYFATLTDEEREIAGYAAFTEAMARLSAIAGEHGFEIVVLAHGRPPKFLKEACNRHGFPLVVIRKYKERFLRENDLQDADNSILTVSDSDPHPSPVGHDLITFGLTDFLVDSGIAARLATERDG